MGQQRHQWEPSNMEERGVRLKQRAVAWCVGVALFPSTSPTCSRASRLTPSWSTPTWRSWVIPNAFLSVPKESTSDWTIMQSLSVDILCHTIAVSGHTWKVADQLTKDSEDMSVIIRNLKGCLVQVGNGIGLEALGLQFEPHQWPGGSLVV